MVSAKFTLSITIYMFNIEPVSDEGGDPQMPKAEFDSHMVRYAFIGTSIHTVGMLIIARRYIRNPKPFKCTVKPRSEEAIKLVKEVCDRPNY